MNNTTPSSREISLRDLSVQEIHLEKAYIYVIDTNLKVFAEAIHVLSKISEQILLQPFEDALVIIAFNSTKSAYGKITLSNNFFTRTQPPPPEEPIPDGDAYCRISTRSLLHMFKNVLTKHLAVPSFDSCQLELNPTADVAIIHFKHAHSQITRVYVLPMKEQTTVFDNIFMERHRLQNKLSTQPKMLLNLFNGLDCQEAKFVASNNQFSAHRYIMREDFGRVRKTEVNVPGEYFEVYQIRLNTQIVISLKELRSILHFTDNCRMAITLHFDRPGRPMIVAGEETMEFQAEFVLATLEEAEQAVVNVPPLHPQSQPNEVHNQTPHLQTTPLPQQQKSKKSRIVIAQTPPNTNMQNLANKERETLQASPSASTDENQSPTIHYSASF